MTIGVLIVGLGQIGMGYDLQLPPSAYVLSHARAFRLHPSFQLLGGVDPDEERRRTLEREYACPAFADIDSALDAVQPRVVVIAVPTLGHNGVLRSVLSRSRPDVVLCEKPLSYDLPEATGMLSECKEHGARLVVNYMRRSDPAVIEIKRRLDSGQIETPVKGVAWYTKGLMHNGSHFLNLLEYWLGNMADARIIEPGRSLSALDSEPDFEATFERGSVVFLAAREENYSHHAIELIAPNGRLRYDNGGREVTWHGTEPDRLFPGRAALVANAEVIESQMNRFQYSVTEQLALMLDGKDAHLSGGDDALRTIAALTTILNKRCTPH